MAEDGTQGRRSVERGLAVANAVDDGIEPATFCFVNHQAEAVESDGEHVGTCFEHDGRDGVVFLPAAPALCPGDGEHFLAQRLGGIIPPVDGKVDIGSDALHPAHGEPGQGVGFGNRHGKPHGDCPSFGMPDSVEFGVHIVCHMVESQHIVGDFHPSCQAVVFRIFVFMPFDGCFHRDVHGCADDSIGNGHFHIHDGCIGFGKRCVGGGQDCLAGLDGDDGRVDRLPAPVFDAHIGGCAFFGMFGRHLAVQGEIVRPDVVFSEIVDRDAFQVERGFRGHGYDGKAVCAVCFGREEGFVGGEGLVSVLFLEVGDDIPFRHRGAGKAVPDLKVGISFCVV